VYRGKEKAERERKKDIGRNVQRGGRSTVDCPVAALAEKLAMSTDQAN